MSMVNKAAAQVHGVVDQVTDAAAPAAHWLQKQGDTLTGGSEKLLKSSSRYVADHPLQSLAIALAAGYLLSRLTR